MKRKRFPQQFREMAIACAAALQFLTILPPFIKRPFSSKELGQSVGYFPLVGFLLGIALTITDWLLTFIWSGNALQIGLLLVFWTILTGALHVDGFLDTCDGLLGGRSASQRLEIMRDPRVGSFAVVGGVFLILLKFAALMAVHHRPAALLLSPVLGRWCISWAIITFPYVRAEGLGRVMKDHAGRSELIGASIIAGLTVAMITLAAGFIVLVAVAVVFLAAWLLARWVMQRIPGFTGDVYGGMCELMELLVLILMTLPGK